MASDFKAYMRPGMRGHLIGIGGVSMSPLAEVLRGRGMEITGSDMNDSESVERLRAMGIPVIIGHRPESVEGADFIVRTAAVHDENPEIVRAMELGIPIFKRAEAWGAVSREYKHSICISGAHGKTTTTSMVTHILMAAKADPTVMIGGTLPLLQSSYRVGHGDTIVLESCEYYNSFHSFFPTIAVILDIDADHLDFFRDLDEIKQSFRHFAEITPQDGVVVANFDDRNTMEALAGIDRRVLTFGLSEQADVRAVHVEEGVTSRFDVLYRDGEFAHIELHTPGHHNIMNALAAVAASICAGIPAPAIEAGLASFSGAARRMEYKGEYNGAKVYDDYAHHPSELRALLAAVSGMGYKRVVCAFQPHTYSRTKALFDDFVEELKKADVVLLSEIYAARETNTSGISSKDLADRIDGAIYCRDLAAMEARLRELAQEGDIILTVGAGDVYKVGERLVKQ